MATKVTKNKKFVKKKPQESCRDFITRLNKGLAFTPEELAEKWGVSTTTIIKTAKDLDAHRWMKDEEGEWEEVILNPETAKSLD